MHWLPGCSKPLHIVVVLGFVLGAIMMLGVSGFFSVHTGACRQMVPPPAAGICLGCTALAGGNDAKTIGIIWLILISAGMSTTEQGVPDLGHLPPVTCTIAAGTMFGGWRIKTWVSV